MVPVPVVSTTDECEKDFPDVFSACVVTRSISKLNSLASKELDLADTFLATESKMLTVSSNGKIRFVSKERRF